MKIYINATEQAIFGMANLRYKTTGQMFDFWVDELGSKRQNKHNEPRFKLEANDVEVDFILHKDDSIEILPNNNRIIQKFKYRKEGEKFIQKFSRPLRMHWVGDIDTGELSAIFRLVTKKGYEVDDAVEAVLNDEY